MVRFVLLCMLGGVKDEICLLQVLEVLEGMHCLLLCVLEVVVARFYSLKILEGLEVPKEMCYVLLCILEVVERGSVSGFRIHVVVVFSLQSTAGSFAWCPTR